MPNKRKKPVIRKEDIDTDRLFRLFYQSGELGINYAHKVGAEVMIMHAYFSPYFPSAIPMGDTLAYQVNEKRRRRMS